MADIDSIRQTIEELEQLAQEMEVENEIVYQADDMVDYTHEGQSGVAVVESVSDDTITVRVMAVAGDTFEPTDDVLTLPFDSVSHMDSDAGEENESNEDDDTEEQYEEEMEKGVFVSWQSQSGVVQGKIVDVSEKESVIIPETGDEFTPENGPLCLIEVYQKNKDEYEDTGVHVAIAPDQLEVIDPLNVRPRQIMMKVKKVDVETDEENKIGWLNGIGSAYGKVDLGGDTVSKGAYTQTISHNDGKIQLSVDHGFRVKDVVGVAYLEDSEEGLVSKSKMPLHISHVKDAFEKAKFMLSEGKPLGYSIEYHVIKSEPLPNGVRLLKEIALEGMTITPWPMDTHARIRDAKSRKITYHAKRRSWQAVTKEAPTPDAPTGNQLREGDYKSLVDEIRNLKQNIEEHHV
jgi:HK97 family phage prohead protease